MAYDRCGTGDFSGWRDQSLCNADQELREFGWKQLQMTSRRTTGIHDLFRRTRGSVANRLLLASVLVSCLLIVLVVLFRQLSPAVAVPQPNTLGANPRVLRLLETAQQAVEQHPNSDSAWGQLGALLMAHHW